MEHLKQLVRLQQKTIEQMIVVEEHRELHKKEALLARFKRLSEEAKEVREQLRARATGLKGALECQDVDDPRWRAFSSQIPWRLVCDYYARTGQMPLAKQIAHQTNVTPFVDLKLLGKCSEIVEGIKRGGYAAALTWAIENRPALKKLYEENSGMEDIEFNLHSLQYIDLISSDSQRNLILDEKITKEALLFAQKHFKAFLKDHFEQIGHLLMLLAIPASTEIKSYRDEYAMNEKRQACAKAFKTVFEALYKMPSNPPLVTLVSAGLSAMKTRSCGRPESLHPDCPVCNGPFAMRPRQLDLPPHIIKLHPELACIRFDGFAAELPYAHHQTTKLVCRITGLPMDENNPPMVLPNGQAYSQKVLKLTKFTFSVFF